MKIPHILNTVLLTAILATLILIFLHAREPVRISGPVWIQGRPQGAVLFSEPIDVRIDDTIPVNVEIQR